MRLTILFVLALTLALIASAQTQQNVYDAIIKNGTVYDGTGAKPRRADVGVKGDRIAAIGDLKSATAATVIDANGLAVAPGFINMLSWAVDDLVVDGRSLGDIRQGVTTEIFGEGDSMGPLNDEMKRRRKEAQGDLKFEIEWTALAESLQYLEKRGVSANVASYIGATTIREHVVGLEDKKATPEQMDQMRELVRREMEAGALGIGSSLIYAPAFYASTEEVIAMVKKARSEGLKITADMYTYPAGATGLDAAMPPWVLDGGYDAAYKRLRDPETRKKIAEEIRTPSDKWENLLIAAGSPDRALLVGFKNEGLKKYTGKTLADVAKLRNEDYTDTIMNLVLEDQSRVGTVYFMMSEENIKKQIKLPGVSFGSDAGSMPAEGVFLKSSTHPRAYGNFSRLLGKYVREEKVIPLEEAIRRLTGLPATNLELDRRGFLREGYFADVVVFDPKTVADRATFEQPHQFAVGVKHVFVNGAHVLKDGEHTGSKPGRALWGPGKIK